MDPQATLAIVTNSHADAEERLEAIDALRRWLSRGGFTPNVDARQLGVLLHLASVSLGTLADA